MSKLKLPSLLQVARNWKETPQEISQRLVALAKHPPQFSYRCLHVVAREIVILDTSYEQLLEYIRRSERRPRYQRTLLEVLPLLCSHLKGLEPDYFQDVSARDYGLAPDIQIPFAPPFIYGFGGQIYVPIFSFWRSNPIGGAPLSLLVSLAEDILLNDADLENAHLQIFDFSKPNGEDERRLRIIDARDVPRLDHREKCSMLEVFADGYRIACHELRGATAKKAHSRDERKPDPSQGDLFSFAR
jgi:hypothetical protein